MSSELGRFPVVYGNSCQTQSVTPKTFGSYAYKSISGTYGIELLWWHSVTNCFGDTHGVQSYGYIKKWEDFPVVFEGNCQNRSITPKTINSNGYKNLLRYIRNITIMVAFRNKWF